MELDRKQVIAIARLAAIKLDEAEVDRFQMELSKILGHIDQLKEVDVDGVEPTQQVTGLTNVTRPDVVEESTEREAIVADFPDAQAGFLKVPNKKG